MLLWNKHGLELTHPGRGTRCPVPDGPKTAPSTTKLWGDAVKAWAIARGRVRDSALRREVDAVYKVTGRAGAEQPFDPRLHGAAYVAASVQQYTWKADTHPPTAKLARYWLARGGEAVVGALRATFRVTARGGQLRERETPESEGLATANRDSNYREGLKELRLWLARADEEAYAGVVAAARAAWDELDHPGLKVALSYLLPTERDLASDAAAAKTNTPYTWLLSQSLADPARAALLRERDDSWRRVIWLFGLVNVLGEDALPALLASREDEEGRIYLPQVISVIGAEAAAPFMADEVPEPYNQQYREAFFTARPELAVAHLKPGDPVLEAVQRAHPALDPDAAERATDGELPAPLREASAAKSRNQKPLQETWKPYSELKLRSGKGLRPDAFERLGHLLRSALKSGSSLTPALREVREALDPDAADDFAIALYDGIGWRRSGDNRWVFLSLMVFAHGRALDYLGAKLAKMDYAAGVSVLKILAAVGNDQALVRLNHVATRGRGGIKRAAQDQIARVARERGLNTLQLADRLVPTLGLDAKGGLDLDYGPRRFRVLFDEALKTYVIDDAGKVKKSLPRPGASDDPALAGPAHEAWKRLKKDARTLASAQVARFEQAMQDSRRWTKEEFTQHIMAHPFVINLARRLVWGVFGGKGPAPLASFRVDEDGQPVDAEDEPFAFPAGRIGVVHPLELGPEAAAAWSRVFSDYELIQPFEQLARPTYPHGSPEAAALLTELNGRTIPGGRILGLTNRGWDRGWVEDAGLFYFVRLRRPELEVTANIDKGVSVTGGYGADEDQTLTIKIKGQGSPVHYSEALYQLRSLLG